jgi:hypothetical protein
LNCRPRRIAGFDEAVVSLYAKGMTTGDIQAHLSDVCGQEISRELVSKVTVGVLASSKTIAGSTPASVVTCLRRGFFGSASSFSDAASQLS